MKHCQTLHDANGSARKFWALTKGHSELTFNLSLYLSPQELAGAFHLVRDVVLEGKVPLVFFDEFDTALNGEALGWLRHFLAPMQDGRFLDREAPHPIGQAIFVFAGGTCSTFREFSAHPGMDGTTFSLRKGPDFLSRLRATLDIPSLNLLTAHAPPRFPRRDKAPKPAQPAGTYDPFGPIESLPCEAAILLRRAAILRFNLAQKAPGIVRADESLNVAPAVLRALLFLPSFEHGNRSFEALMDMSRLAGINKLTPSLLPAEFQVPLHANAAHLLQLIDVDYPFPDEAREPIAMDIHRRYRKQRQAEAKSKGGRPLDQSCNVWKALSEDLRDSNRSQADDIVVKLRSVGLWYRKIPLSGNAQKDQQARRKAVNNGRKLIAPHVERLACAEHDRWTAQKRRQGWIAGPDNLKHSRNEPAKISECLFPWEELSDKQKESDINPIEAIPELLALGGYEVIQP